jgi:hypothetical protein
LAAPPVVTPITPVNGAIGVPKDTAIIFTVIDVGSGVVLSATMVWVSGVPVFDGTNFLVGWEQSAYVSITDGYQFELIPDRSRYARANEETGVRVVSEDGNSNAVNAHWSFTAVSNLGIATYRYLLGAIRDLDERG